MVPREPTKFCDGCQRKDGGEGGVVTALAHSLSVNSPILLAQISVSEKSGQEGEDAHKRGVHR